MSKKVILKEKEKITAYRPANFFAEQLVYARNQNLRHIMDVSDVNQVRLQEVSRFGGVRFLDDTNCRDINALGFAMESIQHPLFWITGAWDGRLQHSSLLPIVAEKVKAVIGIGDDNSILVRSFSPYVEVYDCHTMEQAVKTAYYSADSGDAVLFSTINGTYSRCAGARELSLQFREAVKEL